MQVEIHAKAKHWGLQAYMTILSKVFKGKNRDLKYIDLFCGDGKCSAIVGKEGRNPQEQFWDGPPLYALKKWNTVSDLSVACIFNDKDSEKIDNLRKTIENENLGHLVQAYYTEPADNIVDDIIANHLITPELASLVYLDPQKHSQLSWDTIEKLASFCVEDNYYGTAFVRRPELIINLMTYTMYRSYKQRPQDITRALGTDKWKKLLKEFKDKKNPIYLAFYYTFINQLAKYYPHEGIFPIHVRSPKNPGMNYFLIYTMTHPLAIKIFSRDLYKRIVKYKEEDLAGEYLDLVNLSKGIQSLDNHL